ncbi:MAG: hypothetical protein WEB06_18975 [Actinomycetota bacterium]
MKRRRSRASIGAGVAVALLAGALVALVARSGGSPGERAGVLSHGQQIAQQRTVLVASTGSDQISRPGQPLHTVLVSGSVPMTATIATVLSDENCSPDAAGVSHCTNRLRIDGGGEVTVMHPHRMAEVACLAPGERVEVQAA